MSVIRKRKLCDLKEPLDNDIHKLITRVATSDDVPASIDDVRVSLRERIAPEKMEETMILVEQTIIKCVKYIPHKVHVYATLLRQLGEDNKVLADKVLDSCVEDFKVAMKGGKIIQSKNFLRLFGWLIRSETLNSMDTSFTTILCKLNDDLRTSHKDTIAYLIISTLPWFPLSTAKICLPFLNDYFSSRQRTQSVAVVRPVHVQQFNFIQNSSTKVEDEPDLLELMFKELESCLDQQLFDSQCELLTETDGSADRLLSWKAPDINISINLPVSILHPVLPSAMHLFHPLDENKNPIYNPSGESCNLFNLADEIIFIEREATSHMNRLIIRDLTHDVIQCYSADVSQLATVLSEGLPSPKSFTKMSQAFVVVDAVFGSVFALPISCIPLAGYSAILHSLVTPDGSPFALPVVEAFDSMLELIPLLDPEVTSRFLELFSNHLSMFNFRWTMWDTVNQADQDFRTGTTKKLFNLELMHHLTRTSSRKHLTSYIPADVDKAKVLMESESGMLLFLLLLFMMPSFLNIPTITVIRYKFKSPDIPFKEQADAILRLLRVKNESTSPNLSEAEVEEIVKTVKGIDGATEHDYCDIMMNCILFFGSEGVAYERYQLVKYSDVLKQLVSSDDKHFFVTVTSQFWENSPHRMVTSVKSLLQLEIITPLHVVNWLLTDEIVMVCCFFILLYCSNWVSQK